MTTSILWLGRTMPVPLNAGDRIYSAQLAGAVARQGAHVVFLGLENPDEPGGGSLAQLESRIRWKVVPGGPNSRLLALPSRLPMVGARFATKRYRRAVVQELETNAYDVVVLDQYGMSWAETYVRQIAGNRPVLVHVSHDFETRVTDQIARNFAGDVFRKLLLKENARKTRLAEEHLAKSCNLLVALTEEDRVAFNEINPSLASVVLAPGYAGVKRRVGILDERVPRRAIIVGSFSWIAKQMNLELLLEAAGRIFTQHGVELHVVGVIPAAFLSRLQSRFPWVVFRGFVDDLSEEFRHARIALVPEAIGGGFKLKILDYIFSRVPVAAVEAALNGIPDELKRHFVVASSVDELLKKIVAAIDDLDRLNAMQNRAFELAEELFDWDVSGRRLLQVLQLAANEHGSESTRPLQPALRQGHSVVAAGVMRSRCLR
jgi:glycosyltransferase involved in cell wall biosynthesis